jgi:hypothetical protein
MLYLLSAMLKVDAEDIKPGRDLLFFSFHKTEGHLPDLLPFLWVYRLKGISKTPLSCAMISISPKGVR